MTAPCVESALSEVSVVDKAVRPTLATWDASASIAPYGLGALLLGGGVTSIVANVFLWRDSIARIHTPKWSTSWSIWQDVCAVVVACVKLEKRRQQRHKDTAKANVSLCLLVCCCWLFMATGPFFVVVCRAQRQALGPYICGRPNWARMPVPVLVGRLTDN